jgi:hypothetical protein
MTLPVMAKISNHYAQQFARFVEKLKSTSTVTSPKFPVGVQAAWHGAAPSDTELREAPPMETADAWPVSFLGVEGISQTPSGGGTA